MKFHCDRCKTRYSIADERVRGKILKIRCKNCSAVITVREGMDSAGSGKGAAAPKPGADRPANPSAPRPTLEKAFERAMSSSPPAAAAPAADLRPSGANLGGFDDDATVINDDPSAAIAEAKLASERRQAAAREPSVVRERTPPPMPRPTSSARPGSNVSFTSGPAESPAAASKVEPLPEHLPDHLEEEWYVSLDGDQEGPFTLDEAKQWVSDRRPDDELYCWCEGFDDWLPVEKVSHFRTLRADPVDPRAPTAMATASQQALVPGAEETPRPLFAATMAALEAEQPAPDDAFSSAARSPSGGGANGSSAFDDDDDFDFDVGEASRVVKLPMLMDAMREREEAASARADSSLPGMGDDDAPDQVGTGSGGFATVSRVTGGLPTVVPLGDQAHTGGQPVLEPPSRSRRGVPMWALLASAGTIVVVGAILLIVNMGGDSAGEMRIRRSRVGNENLGISLEPRRRAAAQPAAPADQPSSGRPASRPTRPRNTRPSTTGTQTPSTTAKTGRAYDPFSKDDVTDFGADDPSKPLSADEIMKVYRENRLAVQWCYEQALKKDPLLDIAKTYVFITVAPSGVVTNVRLSAASKTPLGQCLMTRIRRWRFRKSPEVFSSKFPLVFQK